MREEYKKKQIIEKPLHRPVMIISHEIKSTVNSTVLEAYLQPINSSNTPWDTGLRTKVQDFILIFMKLILLEPSHLCILLKSLWILIVSFLSAVCLLNQGDQSFGE